MYHELIKIEYFGNFRLQLYFDNGEKGIVDFQEYINKGGVFSRLSDINFFKKAYIHKELGVLCWPGEIDIASPYFLKQLGHTNPPIEGLKRHPFP